jgi:hypothetical protein
MHELEPAAMAGQADQALQRLHQAVDRGFADVEYLQTRRWFESVRGTAGWVALLERLQTRPGEE